MESVIAPGKRAKEFIHLLLKHTSRGLRRRQDTDKWEVTLSHKDPATGRSVTAYHTIEAKSEKQAQKKRNDLILELARKGSGFWIC